VCQRPSAFDASPRPAATPRYADAGMVVTEIATPTDREMSTCSNRVQIDDILDRAARALHRHVDAQEV
jgi:hypothetical protein